MWAALALPRRRRRSRRSARPALVVALGCLCIFVRTAAWGSRTAGGGAHTPRRLEPTTGAPRSPLSHAPLLSLPPQVNGPVLLSIALSFALGQAIDKSELAAIVAKQMVSLVAPYGELALLFAIYAVAMVVGAVITNNAVVTLMFPVVVRMCEGAGVPWRPAFYALTMASASFSTPVSYQTRWSPARRLRLRRLPQVRPPAPARLHARHRPRSPCTGGAGFAASSVPPY